jgi:RNA polymerase sigma-70 factor (ECF subfamily)
VDTPALAPLPPEPVVPFREDGTLATEETTAQERESAPGAFSTTHWSVVLAAGRTQSPEVSEALDRLCRAYWPPLYSYVRRKGHGPDDAQDLVQEFFARFLEHKYVRFADRSRGRFRTFLLSAFQHFLVNEWKHANRRKRGGGSRPVSIDAQDTENFFLAELADNRSPDKAFERRWALTLLGRVLDQLQAEFVSDERGHLFDELKGFLSGSACDSSYAELGGRLGMTEGNLKVTVHRLRRRYRELLRREISMTVNDPELIDDEIRQLRAALSS